MLPGAPAAHLLLWEKPAQPRLRGLSRAHRASPAPTSGRRAERQHGTTRLPRAGSGCASAAFSARACASQARAAEAPGRWAGTVAGAGAPALAARHCHLTKCRAVGRTRLPPTAENSASEVGGTPGQAVLEGQPFGCRNRAPCNIASRSSC